MREQATRIIAYTCNWNAYSGLETAGLDRLAYAASIHPVRVACLGQLHAGLILKAFELGADGVLMLGCPPGECQYGQGGERARQIHQEAAELAHLLGIGRERVQLDWVAAGDGRGLVERVDRFCDDIAGAA